MNLDNLDNRKRTVFGSQKMVIDAYIFNVISYDSYAHPDLILKDLFVSNNIEFEGVIPDVNELSFDEAHTIIRNLPKRPFTLFEKVGGGFLAIITVSTIIGTICRWCS